VAEGEGNHVSEIILPDNAVVYVSHEGKGYPIYINVGPGGHTVFRKAISPQTALQMAQLLIEYAARELGHPND
jgi:hypothetical protein